MRLLVVLSILVFSNSIWAAPKKGGDSKTRRPLGFVRLSGGYLQSKPFDVTPEALVTDFDEAKGHWAEFDAGFFLYAHFGYARIGEKTSRMNLDNNGMRDVEHYLEKYQYGIKMILPFPTFTPFIGAGLISGTTIVKDVANKLRYSNGTYGRYWHAGMDFLLTKHTGFRISYQREAIRSYTFDVLENNKLRYEQHLTMAGILFHL